MKLAIFLTLSTAAVFLAACSTNPADGSAPDDAIAVATHEPTWQEDKARLLDVLRTNARLRVSEPDEQSIAVQIRSTDSFLSSGANPSSQLLSVLDDIAEALDGQEHIQIEVAGHTDNAGNVNRNLELSAERAKSVADYLALRGLTVPITYIGYGSENPVASNNTREGRAVNRRIDLLIISTEEAIQAEPN